MFQVDLCTQLVEEEGPTLDGQRVFIAAVRWALSLLLLSTGVRGAPRWGCSTCRSQGEPRQPRTGVQRQSGGSVRDTWVTGRSVRAPGVRLSEPSPLDSRPTPAAHDEKAVSRQNGYRGTICPTLAQT